MQAGDEVVGLTGAEELSGGKNNAVYHAAGFVYKWFKRTDIQVPDVALNAPARMVGVHNAIHGSQGHLIKNVG